MSTKETLCIGAVQFEMAEKDKNVNLARMEAFVRQAHKQDVDVVVFPEMCLCGYNFLFQSSRDGLLAIAEDAYDGPSVPMFGSRLHA